jgi:endonuclease YncB( thermonuclease family)
MVLCGLASAQTAVDGDTINMNGATWHLWGIDAPESRQWCGHYPAGAKATEMLEQLMRGKTIDCEGRGTDPYGRTIGLCRANGDDLGATMVRLGMAWAFVQYSRATSSKRRRPGRTNWACMPINACRRGSGGRACADQ